MSLGAVFQHNLEQQGLLPYLAGQRIIAAVSGGADSLCLLHLLNQAAAQLKLTIHVATLDHGLRGAAGADDAAFVVQSSQAWGLPVHSTRRDVQAIAHRDKLGIEEAARLTRYTFLSETAQAINASAIVTGHTADDQIETLLMHLIRGAGLAGLSGMRPAAPLSQQHLLPDVQLPPDVMLLRPLLPFTRAAIEDYCQQHNLTPRHDHTNEDQRYLRNRVRHELLPLLETFNPAIRQTLVRTSSLLYDDYTQLQRMVDGQWQALLQKQTPTEIILERERLRQLNESPALLRGILRRAIQEIGPAASDVSLATIDNALVVALDGATGQRSNLPGGISLRVDYETIVITRNNPPAADDEQLPALPPGTTVAVQLPGQTRLPGSAWVLTARYLSPEENPADYFGQPLTAALTIPPNCAPELRTRRPGDRFVPYGLNGHTQKLKKTFATLKIPLSRRDILPLLTINGEIAWFSTQNHNSIAAPFAINEYNNDRVLFTWLMK